MTMLFDRDGNTRRMAEPVGYAIAAIVLLSAIGIVLEKVGVEPSILFWASFVIVTLATIMSANAVWPTRLSSYAVVGRRAPSSMIASGQIAAMAPAAFAAALWANGDIPANAPALSLAGVAGGLWLSALLFGRAMNRSGAYGLPQLFEARFGSAIVRMLVLIIVAVPAFILICGQVLAFGIFAEQRLRIPAPAGMVAAIAILVSLVWWPGVRGALIAGAISMAALVIAFMSIGGLLDFEFLKLAAPVVGEGDLLARVAISALPFLSEAEHTYSGHGSLAFALSVAAAVSVLPITTQFHPMASSGGRTFRTAIASSVALVVMLAAALTIVPSHVTVLSDLLPAAYGGAVLVDFAASALLHAMLATAAVHMMGFVGLVSMDGYRGVFSARTSENGRLIAARATVLISAMAVGWVVLTWGQTAMTAAVPALFAAGAAIFPATVAAIWWRKCTAPAAVTGMIAGAMVVILFWLAAQGMIEPANLLSESSPVLDFLLGLPIASAALVGMAVSVALIILLSYLPQKSNSVATAFFAAVSDDPRQRLLNETVM